MAAMSDLRISLSEISRDCEFVSPNILLQGESIPRNKREKVPNGTNFKLLLFFRRKTLRNLQGDG